SSCKQSRSPSHLHPVPTRRSSDLRLPSSLASRSEHGPNLRVVPVELNEYAVAAHLDRHVPVQLLVGQRVTAVHPPLTFWNVEARSEEHTSELQSRENLVCRLLHEK